MNTEQYSGDESHPIILGRARQGIAIPHMPLDESVVEARKVTEEVVLAKTFRQKLGGRTLAVFNEFRQHYRELSSDK